MFSLVKIIVITVVVYSDKLNRMVSNALLMSPLRTFCTFYALICLFRVIELLNSKQS